MPFREPPDLDRVDTSFVSRAGTPASEQIRESESPNPASPGSSDTGNPSGKSGQSRPSRARSTRARTASHTSPPAREERDTPSEGEAEGKARAERKAPRRSKPRRAPASPAADEASQFVEPDARMLVNVRMPVALHERLKAASEHTSLTITDIVIRGAEAELEAVEERYRQVTGEPIPVNRRKVKID